MNPAIFCYLHESTGSLILEARLAPKYGGLDCAISSPAHICWRLISLEGRWQTQTPGHTGKELSCSIIDEARALLGRHPILSTTMLPASSWLFIWHQYCNHYACSCSNRRSWVAKVTCLLQVRQQLLIPLLWPLIWAGMLSLLQLLR